MVDNDDEMNLALQHYDGGRLPQAEEICRRIIQLHPDHPKALNLLGIISFRSGRTEEGLSLLIKAITLQPDFAAAHSNLGNAYKAKGRFAEAAASYQRALAIKPDSLATLHNLGGVFEAQGLLGEAAACYRQVLALNPDSAEARNSLGVVLMLQGRLDEATACFRKVLALKPNFVMAYNNLGNVFEEQGRPDKAEASYRRAIEINPDFADGHYNLGRVLADRGKPDEAAASYQRVVTIQPDFFMAYNNLGIIFEEQDRLEEAVACYRRALDLKPDYAEAHNNLGNAYRKRGKLEEAMACYQSALDLKPDYAEAHSNMGLVFHDQGRLDEAAACYREALALKPDDEDVHNNLGNVRKEQGKLTEAAVCYRRAVELRPDFAEVYFNMGIVLTDIGQQDEAAASYRKALAIKPDYYDAHVNLLFCLNYHPAITKEQLFEEHRAWDNRHGRPQRGKIIPWQNDPSMDRPLRIGYVSADFGRHPVGYFLSSVLPAHDRCSFKVFCYSARGKEDDITVHLRASSDVWSDIHAVDDDALAEIIRADAIDILVDLSGHTAGNRLTMFAQKPAPVQMTWAGYVGTTGLSTIDYLISDGRESPEGAERFYTEEVIRLPDCYVCYAPPAYAPPVGPLPALAHGCITFGCFNNLAKVTPQVVALWGLLLKELPDAHLLLKTRALDDDATRARYLSLFASHGIEEGRIELVGASPHPELLGCYNRIDIALDPFPYSGGLTTLESLWMGVPVITLGGERFCSRHTLSHLTAAGLPGLIASGPKGYIETAVALARDTERLAAIRSGLRGRMSASPLCDGSRFTRNLEAAYREAWRRWCGAT
jgi:protein O-GlcNAc transferase